MKNTYTTKYRIFIFCCLFLSIPSAIVYAQTDRASASANTKADNSSIVIDKPTDTVIGDAMIASLGIAGTLPVITQPGGWALIRSTDKMEISIMTKTWDGGAGTTNWGDAANWSSDELPVSTDSIDLTGAHTININVAATVNSLVLNNASLVLTISAGSSLTVSGNLVLIAGTLNTAAAFPTVSGTVNVAGGTVGFTGSGSQTIPAYNYFNLTSSSTGSRTLASSGTIGVAGSFTPGTNTYTIAGSTVNYDAPGAQTIAAFNYNNLTLSNSGTKTFASGTTGIASALSMSGTATANAATNSSAISYNGSTSQTITSLTYYGLNISSTGGTVTGINTTVTNFSINSGTLNLNTFTITTTGKATYTGGVINDGTVTSTGNNTTFLGTVFGAVVNATSDSLYLNGSTFNNTATVTKIGPNHILGTGGNTFNGTTTISNSGSGNLALGSTLADIFNGTTVFNNSGTAALFIAFNSPGNQFNGNVTLNNTGNGGYIQSSPGGLGVATYSGNIVVNNTSGTMGIYFGGIGGTTTLAATKTISVGVTGFASGVLYLNRFTQSGTAAQALTLTGTALLEIGPVATFNGNVNFSSPQLLLHGGTYYGTASLTKTGATDNFGNGGNVFHSTTTITNNGAGFLSSGILSPDIFNGTTTITNNSPLNHIWLAHNSAGNQFNGDVTFNNTASGYIITHFGTFAKVSFNGNVTINNSSPGTTGGICFGGAAGGSGTLAATKTISVGGTGFSNGNLIFSYFTQTGATAQSLSLSGIAILQVGPAATFNGNLNFVAPQVILKGGTFNGTAYIEKNGAIQNNSDGENTFNAAATFANSGSGHLVLGFPTGIDIFNGDLTLINSGTAGIYPAYNTAGHQFKGNIILNQTAGTGIYFCAGTGTATLATGKTISIGGSGFSAGALLLPKFTQAGTTAQTLSFTGTASLYLGPASTFNGNVNFSAPQLYFNGCTYNGTASLTKSGAIDNTSIGGNVFNAAATITNSGSGFLRLATTSADDFNSSATFIKTGSGLLQPAYTSNSTFAGNLSTAGTTSAISFGATVTFDGTGAQSILGSYVPAFNNLTISNTGNTVTAGVNTSVAGNLSVSSGTFDLGIYTVNRLTAGGTLTISNGAKLKIGSTNTIPSNYTTHSIGATSTIEYSGTNQSVAVLNSTQDYGNLIISASGTKTISGNLAIRNNLTISAGSLDISTTAIKIGGVINNSGTFIASNGTIELNGSLAQIIPSSVFSGNAIKGLTINNVTGVTLGGALSLTGVLTVSNGSLTTNGYLTLKSSATANARVAQITSAVAAPVNGSVTVERYIPGRRKYRLITSSVTTSASAALSAGQENLSIWGNWQNSGSSATANAGTFITGGSSADGFDTQTGNASLFTYDDVNRRYTGFTSANGKNTKYTPLKAGVAYYMFVYGDRTNSTTSSTPNYTVLKQYGTLLTGDQVYTSSSNIPISNVANRFTMLGNPFASSINWATVQKTNISDTYWGWDPNLSSTGGYVTVNTVGNVTLIAPYSGSTGLNEYIQPGQGFFVKTTAAAPSLTIREQDKVDNFNANAFRSANTLPLLAINLYYENNNSTVLADGVIAAFDPSFSNHIGKEDAGKMVNSNESLSIINGNELLSIDGRQMPQLNDTIYLHIERPAKTQYTLQIFAQQMPADTVQPYLQDYYLKTIQHLSLSDTNNIVFNVDPSIPATGASNRFSIVFRPASGASAAFISINATQKNKDVEISWVVAADIGTKKYVIERSGDGAAFTKIGEVASRRSDSVESYSFVDVTAMTGNNYYRIRAIDDAGNSILSKSVLVMIEAKKLVIRITPNPVTGGRMNVSIADAEKGAYGFVLVNLLGQRLIKQNTDHPGGLLSQTIQLKRSLKRGVYYLNIRIKNNQYTQPIFVE